MDLFDSHAHLNVPEFRDDLDAVLRRAADLGVRRILCVGIDLPSSRRAVELAARRPEMICAAAGIHPNSCSEAGPDDWAALAELIARPEVVAVGETGLDFYREHAPRPAQMEGFRRHLELAARHGKPLIVHARKSDPTLLALLSDAPAATAGVRHCFEGDSEVARSYLNLGFYVSLAAAVTRPGYKRLKAAVRELPEDRLLVETDCPWQVPAGRSEKRNEPAFLEDVVRAAAELRGEEPSGLAARTAANAEALFGP